MIEFYKTGEDGSTARVDGPGPGCWASVVEPTDKERVWLAEEMGVVKEFVASALDPEESSHVDFDDDTGQALVIVDYPAAEEPEEADDPEVVQFDTRPLSMLFLPDRKMVVTVCLSPCETVDAFAAGKVRQFDTRLRARFLLQALYNISQQYLTCLGIVSRQFAKTDRTLRRTLKNSDLIKMLGLEKSLLYFSTSLKADEATLTKIRLGRVVKLYDDDQDLLDDVLIEIGQAIDMTGIYTSILTRTMDTFGSVISNNMNSAMRKLTVITVVLAIPTIVFSFYGMNVGLPLDASWLFPAALSVAAGGLTAALLSRFF